MSESKSDRNSISNGWNILLNFTYPALLSLLDSRSLYCLGLTNSGSALQFRLVLSCLKRAQEGRPLNKIQHGNMETWKHGNESE